MSSSEEILVSHDAAVATITLNRPDQLNSLTLPMLEAFSSALTGAVASGARAIVITGSGRAFCTGAALGNAKPPPGEADLGERIAAFYEPVARTLANLPVPVISAINGPAAGAGAAIALSADIIIAARSAYFLFAFANVGLVPDTGATWLLAHSLGRVRTLELLLLPERLPADEAGRQGLVTRVIDSENLLAETTAIAKRLAAMPTLAMGLIRRQVRCALDMSFEDSLGVERENQQRAGFSADYVEGVRAFADKRNPSFVGH